MNTRTGELMMSSRQALDHGMPGTALDLLQMAKARSTSLQDQRAFREHLNKIQQFDFREWPIGATKQKGVAA